jgi:hypothetical protein
MAARRRHTAAGVIARALALAIDRHRRPEGDVERGGIAPRRSCARGHTLDGDAHDVGRNCGVHEGAVTETSRRLEHSGARARQIDRDRARRVQPGQASLDAAVEPRGAAGQERPQRGRRPRERLGAADLGE